MESIDEVPEERAVLKWDGQAIAEAWFQADAEGPLLIVRVPQDRAAELTLDQLLAAAAVPADEVSSARADDLPIADFAMPLPVTAHSHVLIRVRLRSPDAVDDVPLEKWQALDVCWKTILGLEASIDVSRLGMESLQSEMQAAFKRQMNVEEKLHALQADIAQWNKAKSRVHYALPKVREFVHRATWALAVPERKALEEIYKNHIEPRKPLPNVDRVRERLEHFQKDRQVLLAQGNSVLQECRSLLSEIQRAYATLQRNANDNARRKRSASREKGKHF